MPPITPIPESPSPTIATVGAIVTGEMYFTRMHMMPLYPIAICTTPTTMIDP